MMLRVRGPEGQGTLKIDEDCTIDTFRQLLAEKTGVPPAQQELRGGFPPKRLDFPLDGGAAAVTALGLRAGDSLTVTQLPLPVGTGAAASNNGQPAVAASASVAGLSEDEQLARAIALSLGETVPDLPGAAPPQPPVSATAPKAAAPQARATSPVRAHPTSANAGKGAAAQQGAPIAVPLADGTAVVRRIIDSDNSCLFNAVGYVTQHSRRLAPQLRWAVCLSC